ncbi:MAG: Asp-tRNA(Asn)/Glu-tRNA(Gln) amidotransferase subunit GatC [Armatimonadetes bacterium]|nr:Asp-tRNA(Asn)/Glu-tRNA(Gln) amidotransferase subunit GatC [Armatimonadota bacterium]
MLLTREQVDHVGMLARLELDEEEREKSMRELNQILEHFEKLAELDTTGVPPTSHAIPRTNVLRDDTPKPSLDRGKVLANAPESADGCFRVPRVVET